MTQETSPAPDWYEDPEFPGRLRYWDGQAWTEHRAERADTPAPTSETVKGPKPPKEPRTKGEASFPLVVAGVLGSALVLVMFIAVVVIWFDSYSSGHARGEQARDSGINPSGAPEYCEDAAKNITAPGSAAGYWDYPWVWGCKRALG